MNLQPPKDITSAQHEMNSLRAELDTEKVPRWRRDEIERRLAYLRGWLHGLKSAGAIFREDNIVEQGKPRITLAEDEEKKA